MMNRFGVTDDKGALAFYSAIIALLLTKSGPVTITTDDINMLEISGLIPFIDPNIEGGFRVILVGEDEIQRREDGTWTG